MAKNLQALGVCYIFEWSFSRPIWTGELEFIALVNPTGFSRGHRFNKYGENPNRGFVFENGKPKANEHTSVEGKLLLDHAQLLIAACRDGILTCHEDVLSREAYVYSFEPSQVPGRFSLDLRDTLGGYFPIAVDGEIDACPVKDGLIFNHFDTSFEACLVRSGARVGLVPKHQRCKTSTNAYWQTVLLWLTS